MNKIFILLDHGSQRIIVGYTKNPSVLAAWLNESPITRSYELITEYKPKEKAPK